MSNAYNCDRCGVYFDSLPHDQRFKDPRERDHPVADLCPSCHTGLRAWWEKKSD